ncbi:hypothetical protein LJB86_05585 [Deltaproteobacteria bacterium OttesenSCG-928-M10]|nr:hypothetical protein [Deltaproteobacteria bacterium OttesenSCG-928-M10]
MRKFSLIAVLAMFLAAALIASGCMVSADKAVFKSSKVDMPDLSGAFKNEKGETFLLSRVEGATNTFTLTAPDKNTMTIIFEPLKTAGHYVFQIENKPNPEVLLGICEIENNSLKIYRLVPAAVTELGKDKKYGVIIDENGRITKKPNNKKLKDFFEACFAQPNSALVTTVKPGSAPPAGQKKK